MDGMQQLMEIIRSRGNPGPLIKGMMERSPQLRSAMELLDGKNQQQQMTMLENMAKEKGTTLREVAQRMGLPL